MTRFSKLGMFFAVGAMAFVATPRASANAELILSDGIAADTVTVTSANCGAGCYLFNGTVGSWNINVTTGTTNPGQSPEIDLNSINHHNAGTASTLTIEFSANGYTPAVPGFQLNVGGTVSANGTVTSSLYGGTTNTLGDLSNQIGTTLSFSNPPISFSGSESAYLASLSSNPYALTEVATISFGASAGQASFDYSVDAIPEPAGVLLLGSVMLLTVSVIRRRVGVGSKRA
jgi:hypothetical protein